MLENNKAGKDKKAHSLSELGFGEKTLTSATSLIFTLYKLPQCFIRGALKIKKK